MDLLLILLRLLHILLGVYWAGAVFFMTVLLAPAIGDAGPDGGKVMAALIRRRMLDLMPAAALVTVLSGFWMYVRLSGGDPAFARSRFGMLMGIGGVLGLVALVIGMTMMRPNALRVGALSAQAAGLPEGAERSALMAQALSARERARAAGRIVAVLLAVTVILMAVARYV